MTDPRSTIESLLSAMVRDGDIPQHDIESIIAEWKCSAPKALSSGRWMAYLPAAIREIIVLDAAIKRIAAPSFAAGFFHAPLGRIRGMERLSATLRSLPTILALATAFAVMFWRSRHALSRRGWFLADVLLAFMVLGPLFSIWFVYPIEHVRRLGIGNCSGNLPAKQRSP
jgi:hypothetical protein